MRHCPHCGLIALKTDGCDSVTCGADAPDKGGIRHSDQGCGKNFQWDKARRYKAKCAMDNRDSLLRFTTTKKNVIGRTSQDDKSSDIKVQHTGVLFPPRMCRICYKIVHKGTCFEELSALSLDLMANPLKLVDQVEKKIREIMTGNNIWKPLQFRGQETNKKTVSNITQQQPYTSSSATTETLQADNFAGLDTATLKLSPANFMRQSSQRFFSKVRVMYYFNGYFSQFPFYSLFLFISSLLL